MSKSVFDSYFPNEALDYAGQLAGPAPETTPMGEVSGWLGDLNQTMGGPLLNRMQQHGQQQQQRRQMGDYSPTRLTPDNMGLADDVAGSFLGPIGLLGTIKKWIGSGKLTKYEAEKLQELANQYQTAFEVVGSRSYGKGRNIDTDLPLGKGPNTRSDIDLLVDPQAVIDSSGRLADDLKNALPVDIRSTGFRHEGTPAFRFEPETPFDAARRRAQDGGDGVEFLLESLNSSGDTGLANKVRGFLGNE